MQRLSSPRTPSRRQLLVGAAGITLGTAALAQVTLARPAHAAAYGPSRMYTPPSGAPAPKVLYPRAIQLKVGSAAGTMLATFEQYSSGTPSFPIFRSTDGGVSWSQYSTVSDTVNGWGLRYQPFLYELPTAIGNFPAGTVLCFGNSIPNDLSKTKLDVYASRDQGRTWTFVSAIASGGRAYPDNGETPVWEPFALVKGSQLAVFYSDQRDPAYGQKIVHQTTSNLLTWGGVVNDVTAPDYADRPGMPVIAALPNNRWIMTYEYGGAPEGGNFAVYYRISTDPFSWSSAPEQVLRTTEGQIPTSGPYVTWVSGGGPEGTIVVSATSDGALYLNTSGGALNTWVKVPTPVGACYSRATIALNDGKTVFLLDAGRIGGSSNTVNYGAVEIGGTITSGSTYTLFNRNSNLVIGVKDGSTAPGAGLLQSTNTGAPDRFWKLERQSNGYWRVRNGGSGLVTGITDQKGANGTPAVQWSDNGTLDHDWVVVPYPGGGFVFANRKTGKLLEIGDASTKVGVPVQQWQYTGHPCQAWNLG